MAIQHHTKTKGDLGVLKAQVDLAENGYLVCLPLTEHAPFDLIAYRDGVFKRVQVKYKSVSSNGSIHLSVRSCYSTSKGTQDSPANRDEIDIICIYCPDTDCCYYVTFDQIGPSDTLALRVSAPKNNQKQGVTLADDYRRVP